MKQVVSLRGPQVEGQRDLSMAEARHRQLELRLQELGRRALLTPSERLEIAELKKRKLRAKDEITALRSR